MTKEQFWISGKTRDRPGGLLSDREIFGPQIKLKDIDPHYWTTEKFIDQQKIIGAKKKIKNTETSQGYILICPKELFQTQAQFVIFKEVESQEIFLIDRVFQVKIHGAPKSCIFKEYFWN